jgi:hypothetical protein
MILYEPSLLEVKCYLAQSTVVSVTSVYTPYVGAKAQSAVVIESICPVLVTLPVKSVVQDEQEYL